MHKKNFRISLNINKDKFEENHPHIIKLLENEILKVDIEKQHVTNKGTTNDSNDSDFSSETIEKRRQQNNIFTVLKENNYSKNTDCATELQGLGTSVERKGLHPAPGPF